MSEQNFVLIHPADVGDNPKTQSSPNPNLEFVILGIISETWPADGARENQKIAEVIGIDPLGITNI